MGSEIGIEPSSIIYDEDWISIVVFAAFVAHIDPTNLNNTTSNMICHFYKKDSAVSVKGLIHLQKDLVTPKFDHLRQFYFARECFTDMINWVTEDTHDFDGIKLVFEMEDDQQPQGLCIEIKNLGFRWVYKQDIEGLMRTMTLEGSSSNQIHKDLGIGTPVLSLESRNRSE